MKTRRYYSQRTGDRGDRGRIDLPMLNGAARRAVWDSRSVAISSKLSGTFALMQAPFLAFWAMMWKAGFS